MFIQNAVFVADESNKSITFSVKGHEVRISTNGQRIVYDETSVNWYSERHKAIIGAVRKLEDAIVAAI